VPADRPLNEGARTWALETVARAGERPRVLDLGCGDGRISCVLAQAGAEVIGIDPSAGALSRARTAYPDIEFAPPREDGSFPFADGCFDAVVCINVLEHVADTQRLMSEARRVLAPGGRIAITVPCHGRIAGAWHALTGFERMHDPLEPTLRFYTRRSLAALLGQFGYGEVEVAGAGGVPLFRRTLLARAARR
jgi:ubiquinone/menaquinone biosynthesis C-methylase UbiE